MTHSLLKCLSLSSSLSLSLFQCLALYVYQHCYVNFQAYLSLLPLSTTLSPFLSLSIYLLVPFILFVTSKTYLPSSVGTLYRVLQHDTSSTVFVSIYQIKFINHWIKMRKGQRAFIGISDVDAGAAR